MFESIKQSAKFKQFQHQAHQLVQRGFDQHVKLAVTGLSRSGKTAFITALVQHLTEQANSQNLPFFSVVQQHRMVAAKAVPQSALDIPTFPYRDGLNALLQGQWPESTERINTLRLAIKYRSGGGLRAQFSENHTLIVDLIDYPGEWLMDLPMLDMDYSTWSKQQLQLLSQAPRVTQAKEFLSELEQFDASAPVDEQQLAKLARQYQALLVHFKHDLKLSVLQPGRMLMPGDLAGAPILAFFPLPEVIDAPENSGYFHLKKRYQAYVKDVVQHFYQQHFCHFDRQIILVDLLSSLEQGAEVFAEQNQAINQLLSYFSYGKSNFIKRLFAPKIDKLLFAATKSDHLSAEHHKDLALLLDDIVAHAKNNLVFDGIKIETMAMSSVASTKAVQVMQDGEKLNCISGKEMKSQHQMTFLPAQPPMRVLSATEWPKHGFNFPSFYPDLTADKKIRHVRIDHVLEFLLGDKLR
ncbi:YcjX family protein [Pseudoalteromonas tunicata]|uniref:YcjX family protein n=1 Tax=Pseudoalteromonas tunicata TaxID=314281 RepID=UPI00273D7FCA|nr:YcjX family protein [Pseudoalteromonas tunicata]MDP4984053.1 YcjX family protein [Pseudoalteromonas tunicata]